MDAVGGDHGVGARRGAVGKAQCNAIAAPIDIGQLLVEREPIGGHLRDERFVKIAAVHQEIRRAVFRLGVGAERQLVFHGAAVPLPVGPGLRLERPRADARLQADAAQHPHGIGRHLDAGAEPREARRLLVDTDRKAALMQARRRA